MFTSYHPSTSTTSVGTSYSQTPLVSRPCKDYSAAFASLQNDFGFNGYVVPVHNPKPLPKTPVHTRVESRSSTPAQISAHLSTAQNYEAAFGTLSSSFGPVGGAPLVPRHSATKTKSTFGRSSK